MTRSLSLKVRRANLETLPGSTDASPDAALLRIYRLGGRLCVGVRVSPSAPRSELRGLHGQRLKVAVGAPPEDNRANRELEQALAGWLGLGRDDVCVLKGHTSRDKVVAFSGLTEDQLKESLTSALHKCGVAREEGPVGS
jgi:uncharacterized protein